jgi:biotin carboxyl carrier protein
VGGARHLKVTAGGREHDVKLGATDEHGAIEVHVDGQPYRVRLTDQGEALATRVADGQQLEVTLAAGERADWAAAAGFQLPLEIVDAAELALVAGKTGSKAGGARVASPMPGRIVRVMVEVGQKVAAGDPAVIVEAMKMENELRFTAAGTVTRVAVVAGGTVDAGQVLCEISPHDASG